MALILDKTITDIVSGSLSGGTTETGYTNLNIIDEFGNIHENPYLVVDSFNIDKSRFFIKIEVSIYKDKVSRDNIRKPIQTLTRSISGEEDLYNQYFSIENMDGNNVFKACYEFIQNTSHTRWMSDEV